MTDLNTSSTEERIKKAAQEVFHKKGYSATRTRDIADASGENLALINYYFRSKENLYRIVMMETMMSFMNTMIPVFNNEQSSLDEKINQIVANYIDLFLDRPDVPLFILNELNSHTKQFMDHVPMKQKLLESFFFEQLKEKIERNGSRATNPLHYFFSILGMTIFPFAAAPMVKGTSGMTDLEFAEFMQERKRLIPIWVKAMLNE